MQYHIMNIVPAPESTGMMHGLYGHAEVIETVRWGLSELGHSVTIADCILRQDCTNIIFGAQVLELAALAAIPPNSIVYNLEQIARLEPGQIRDSLHYIAGRFQLWDYDPINLEAWARLQPLHPPKLVPIGWSPTLRRIQKRAEEDIDILLYGKPVAARYKVFHQTCQAGLKCVFACGLYGGSRDDLIGRSKLVLNINSHSHSRVFEIVRVSYLLANAKAVVSDIFPDSLIDPDLRNAVAFVSQESIAAKCLELIKDDSARTALGSRGQTAIEKRDIREILRRVL